MPVAGGIGRDSLTTTPDTPLQRVLTEGQRHPAHHLQGCTRGLLRSVRSGRTMIVSAQKGKPMSRYASGTRRQTILRMELHTRARPSEREMRTNPSSPPVLYVSSYLWNRTIVGAIGVLLPLTLMVVEGIFTTHGLRPEGSISAYYHTTAGQDIFVGGLCAVAIMLLTYMAGQVRSVDFIVSTVAGLALLGVVFFPTARGADLHPAGGPLCGPHTVPEPVSCSPTESTFGEAPVSIIHACSAITFIVALAAVTAVFAYRAWCERHLPGPPQPWRWMGYTLATGLILASGGLALAQFSVGAVSSLYAGEVGALVSFGVAWFVNGEGIRCLLHRPHHGTPDQAPRATLPPGSPTEVGAGPVDGPGPVYRPVVGHRRVAFPKARP